MVPIQGAQVQSLVRELDPTGYNEKILHAATKTQHSQYVFFLQIQIVKKKKKEEEEEVSQLKMLDPGTKGLIGSPISDTSKAHSSLDTEGH